MGGGMAVQPFQGLGIGQQFLDALVLFRLFLKSRLHFQGVGKGDVQDIGNEFGDGVHLSIGDIHGPTHIPDHRLGQHLAEGDNLRHIVPAVFFRYVTDYLVPAFLTEIDVDIRHALPVGIEESLEEKPIADGINLGDSDSVGDQAAGR